MIRLIPIANSLEKLSKTQFYDESSLYQGFLEFLSIKTPGDISYIAFYNAKEAEFSRCYCSNIALNEYKDAKGATMSPALLELWYDSFKRREAVVITTLWSAKIMPFAAFMVINIMLLLR